MTKPGNYLRYTYRMNVDKALHTLEGFLKGIAIDSIISNAEINKLNRWKNENIQYLQRHPFNEILPVIDIILTDGTIAAESKDDLLWIFNNIQTDNIYYDALTSDIQRLHGLLQGILADGVLTDLEIRNLYKWVIDNDHLKGCYPFDEIESLLTSVLADGKVDDQEQMQLKTFFQEFAGSSSNESSTKQFTISGVCASCPKIEFEDKVFCLTGESKKASRNDIINDIRDIGGTVIGNIRQNLDYLIVCAEGNSCWAFSCYGRKIEKALDLRKKGFRISLVHENDLWDAFEDQER